MRTPALILVGLLSPAVAAAGTISLSASDGVTVKATTYGSGAKGVVLVHDDGRSAEDWKTFASKLSTNGFNVVAVDLRGHGSTGGNLAEADYPLMVNDVDAAATWLAGKGAEDIMVVGAGLGANLALNVAASNDEVSGVAMLTPSLNAHGVKVSAAIAGLGNRPLLLVADEGDAGASKAATLIGGKTVGPTEVKLYPSAGSGARMLNGVPELEGLLIGWLNGSWRGPEGAAGERNLSAGNVDEVETTGTKLEDRAKR